jgi:hypothetical protein
MTGGESVPLRYGIYVTQKHPIKLYSQIMARHQRLEIGDAFSVEG